LTKPHKNAFWEKEKKKNVDFRRRRIIMGKKMSGAQKRKKRKEKEEAVKEAAADMERLKLGPTKIWTGLVLHHKDVFVSHVLSKLNTTDRFFFSEVNRESRDVLKYAGVDVSAIPWCIVECSSISTLEWAWNHYPWGEEDRDGWRCERSNVFLQERCCNEQTRVPQVGERSETVRVG
jgi:hypothetical protein